MSNSRAKGAPEEPLQASPRDEHHSLDPQDWGDFRALCHEMLDEALGHLESAASRPVWRPIPDRVKQDLAEPLPLEPQGAKQVCADFRRLVLPYSLGNTHPRFFGWVHGTGTPGGMLAELLAGAVNANLGGREHAPVYVERAVIDWSRRIFGFPKGASGLLVSGTSMATLIGLTVARNHLAGHDVRKHGLGSEAARLTAYTSAQAHGSVAKAMEILGLGQDQLRAVPVTERFEMDLAALAEAVADDRAQGLRPFCVIGTAGTVNTGAIDDLAGIAAFAARENLWFHLDGAFGALGVLSEETQGQLAGIERADSLAFDFHKWLHVPYDAGCILVRDGALHRAAFSSRQEYLAAAERGLAGGNPWFCEYGPELSRGFRALKVWFTLKEHGIRRLGGKVAENCRQARYLAEMVAAHPRLELLAPVSLNIVCFRFVDPQLPARSLDPLNEDIVMVLQERGIAAPSTTKLGGRKAIRVNITNHRSRLCDFDTLVEAVVGVGSELAAEARRGTGPDFRPPEIARIDEAIRGEAREVIKAACRRPELLPLSGGLTISLDPGLAVPFTVTRGSAVVLGPSALANPAVLALHLRHAFELALLQGLTPGPWTGTKAMALGLVACRAAGLYERQMIAAQREACRQAMPDWLAQALALATADQPATEPAARAAPVIAPLLQLQGLAQVGDTAPPLDDAAWREAAALVETLGSLAAPAEYLLTTGGDTRLQLDPASGLNAYGCSPRPRPWAVTFASSTATSISEQAYREVERLRRTLLSAALLGDLQSAYEGSLEGIKTALLAFCGAPEPGAEVVLSTSGTDVEFYALHLAQAGHGEPVTNILIAPDETGRGVVHAAGGRHFAAITALGLAVEAGRPLDEIMEDQVTVKTVAARGPDGALRPLAEIDRLVTQLVEEALGEGRRCLLHLLETAKTGWGAPSLALVTRLLADHPKRLDVVVDACQMRAGPEVMRGYLERGFMVQVTGSKFFTGPPFSGALILPPAIAARSAKLEPLPASFAGYATRAEWPAAWNRLCANLAPAPNLGLLGRWTAAIWEMTAFHAVPRAEQRRILTRFGEAVSKAIAASEAVVAATAPVYDRGALGDPESWDRVTTIFPFTVLRGASAGSRGALDYEDARRVYRWLNRDIAAALPEDAMKAERRIAAQRCHIGQPVKIAGPGGSVLGALRLCAGARIVSGVAFDPALGPDPEARLKSEIADALLVLDKVALIVRHWDVLEGREMTAGAVSGCYQV